MIFGPRFERGAQVQRTDTGEHGTMTGDSFGDYTAVRWRDGTTSWIRLALLRLVPMVMS